MDTDTRTFMQDRFDADFSAVRIHTGSEAVQMNRQLDAKAFTVGKDIYFDREQYNPGSGEGKHLLAHELAHWRPVGKRRLMPPRCQRIKLSSRRVRYRLSRSVRTLILISRHSAHSLPSGANTR